MNKGIYFLYVLSNLFFTKTIKHPHPPESNGRPLNVRSKYEKQGHLLDGLSKQSLPEGYFNQVNASSLAAYAGLYLTIQIWFA